MEEKKKAPFPGTFFQKKQKFAIFLLVSFGVISLSNTVQKYHKFLHAFQS